MELRANPDGSEIKDFITVLKHWYLKIHAPDKRQEYSVYKIQGIEKRETGNNLVYRIHINGACDYYELQKYNEAAFDYNAVAGTHNHNDMLRQNNGAPCVASLVCK